MRNSLRHAGRQMFTPPQRFEAAMEQAFLAHYCAKFSSYRRVAIILGAVSWISYLGWDLHHGLTDPAFKNIMGQIVAWRLIGFVFLVVISGFSLVEKFSTHEHYASYVLMIGNAGAYAIGYWMMYITPFPYDYLYYYFALLIGMVFGFSVLRLRASSTTALLSVYVVATITLFQINYHAKLDTLQTPAELIYMTKAATFIFSMAIIGYIVGIQNERAERAAFQSENALKNFNALVLNRNKEVENLNKALEQSNLDTLQKTAALIDIKDKMRIEADRRNHEKSHFLANAVHDLRQPIQAIGNALEPIKKAITNHNPALTFALIDVAQDASNLMRNQLSAILEISRLESGFAQPDLQGFEVTSTVKHILHQLQPMARDENVRLNMVIPVEVDMVVHSDKMFLGRILANIIGNGIKYRCPDKTQEAWVNITVTSMPAFIRIEIQDNGIGISQEHLLNDAIFKPFFQLNNQRHENEKGVGLGLSIVNAMLALLPEHRLEVRSIVNEGTTFALEVPRAAAITLLPLANSDDAPAAPTPLLDVPGKYVLMVEDDNSVRTTTLALLSAHGILTEGVASVRELRGVLHHLERVPDLVLSDYRLPDGMTALDVASAVEAVFGALPMLIMTAGSMNEYPSDLTQRYTILRKPISPTHLLQAISVAIHDHQHGHEMHGRVHATEEAAL